MPFNNDTKSSYGRWLRWIMIVICHPQLLQSTTSTKSVTVWILVGVVFGFKLVKYTIWHQGPSDNLASVKTIFNASIHKYTIQLPHFWCDCKWIYIIFHFCKLLYEIIKIQACNIAVTWHYAYYSLSLSSIRHIWWT